MNQTPTTFSVRAAAQWAGLLLAVFPITVVCLTVVQRGTYDSWSQAMSELALGTGGTAMFVAFTSMSAGTLLLALCLRRAVHRCRVAPVLLTIAAGLDVVSAIFHTNAQGTPDTLSSTIHMWAGITTFLLLIAAMTATSLSFRKDPRWQSFAPASALWTLVAFAAFFLVPILGDNLFGLAQRTFVAAWLSWLITTAVLIAKGRPSADETETGITTTAAGR